MCSADPCPTHSPAVETTISDKANAVNQPALEKVVYLFPERMGTSSSAVVLLEQQHLLTTLSQEVRTGTTTGTRANNNGIKLGVNQIAVIGLEWARADGMKVFQTTSRRPVEEPRDQRNESDQGKEHPDRYYGKDWDSVE